MTAHLNNRIQRDSKGRFADGSLVRRHGQSAQNRTPEYSCWDSMKQRCLNQSHTSYENYGGRGITICEAWLSFDNFFNDMGQRPSPRHTLERIDNNRGYEPGNCKWATRGEQLRNTRRSRYVEHDGQRKVIADWADEYGIPRGALLMRLRNNWPFEKALKTPVRKTSKSGRKYARLQ